MLILSRNSYAWANGFIKSEIQMPRSRYAGTEAYMYVDPGAIRGPLRPRARGWKVTEGQPAKKHKAEA